MKKAAVAVLLLLVAVFYGGLSGCVLVTRFEQYDLQRAKSADFEEANSNQSEGADAFLHVAFGGTKRRSWIVPGFYSSEITGEPFRHNLVVWGNFERLDGIAVTLQFDDDEPISLVIDLDAMNASRKQARDGRSIFVAEDDSYRLKKPWPEFERIRIRATVEAKIGGEDSVIELMNEYEKRYFNNVGNRFLSAMMSV